VYIYRGGEAASGYDNTVRTRSAPNSLKHFAHSHSHPTFYEHRECGSAGLRNHSPHRDTCTGVWAISFWGAYSRLLASSAQPALIKFLAAGVVRGTNCVHLSASTAYDYIEHTHEMSRVNGATDALSIRPSEATFCSY
jgi:hypothetical protein